MSEKNVVSYIEILYFFSDQVQYFGSIYFNLQSTIFKNNQMSQENGFNWFVAQLKAMDHFCKSDFKIHMENYQNHCIPHEWMLSSFDCAHAHVRIVWAVLNMICENFPHLENSMAFIV